jgi:hypothetical protein
MLFYFSITRVKKFFSLCELHAYRYQKYKLALVTKCTSKKLFKKNELIIYTGAPCVYEKFVINNRPTLLYCTVIVRNSCNT